ncbi:MAG TPA: sigma-70 family RNA polymerase sigma factor [Prolixibacteraceae bacterium]|jgi:RNA polymerase sigma factor (sigma-70 family)
MIGIEVLDPLAGELPVTWIQTNVKEKLNIGDIIKNYGSRLQGFIRKRVRSTEDADDILQEVYFQLVDADRLMKPIDQMSAWLYTVARNRITDLYRKKKPEPMPEYLSETDGESLFAELNDLMFDNGSTPETDYLRSLVWTELDKALNELPEEQRQVFELTEMKGLSFKAISEQTGVAVNTLISRKRYAVLYLRERMLLIYDELINF